MFRVVDARAQSMDAIAMTEAELIDLKERLVIGEPLSPRQRDYALKCINEANADIDTALDIDAAGRLDFDDARRTLVALLSRSDDAPIEGIDEVSNADQCFMVATCAAKMIEAMVCMTRGYREREALRGLDSLVEDMRGHIREICRMHN
jgi:hypothetical protein